MTDTSKREELIKEAAKAIQEVRWVAVRNSDGSVSSHEADSETLARAAVAVFEQAHTPTDEPEQALSSARKTLVASGTTEDGVIWALSRYDGTFWLSVSPGQESEAPTAEDWRVAHQDGGVIFAKVKGSPVPKLLMRGKYGDWSSEMNRYQSADIEEVISVYRWVPAGMQEAWASEIVADFRPTAVQEPQGEMEWEYGYTSKWGTIAAASQEDAETRAADLVCGITEARESGDLKHHGKVVKRIAASKAGPWMPVDHG